MQGKENQSESVARSRTLLRKIALKWIFIFQILYLQLILRTVISIYSKVQALLINHHNMISSLKFQLINYDVAQLIESSSPRSNDDLNRFGPAGVSLPHDICRFRSGPVPTYIHPHSDPPIREPVQHYPGASIPPLGIVQAWRIHKHGYTILPPSLHSQCTVIISHTRIAQMLGLPEYVASTASHDHRQLYNDRSLIDTGWVTTSRSILGASQDSSRSRFVKHDHPHTSGSSLTLAKPTSSIYIYATLSILTNIT
jgi:hypothetical protein